MSLRHLAAGAIVWLTACGGGVPSPPPSFVLVTLDTTRPDHLGAYGYAPARTPRLDAFAAGARTYGNAYATSSWTLPSHASIFTGLWPFEHGAGDSRREEEGGRAGIRPLDRRFVTLAERLAEAGHRTGAVVAGPALAADLGVAQGFEAYRSELTGLEVVTGRRARWVADEAIALVESFGSDPYFLFVNFFDPHSPYWPPPAWRKGLVASDAEAVNVSVLARRRLPAGEAPALRPEELESLAALRAGYDAEIAYMDAHLGRLLDAVEAAPQAERTWVIVTSDHGESFGEHFFVAHGLHLYEDMLRVPLLVRRPGEPEPGAVVEEPVQNHRLFGTILRAAGVEAPEGSDARPLGEGPIVASGPLAQLALQLPRGHVEPGLRALWRPPLKLITRPGGPTELYDLERDPRELDDLASRRPDEVARLLAELQRLEGEHGPRFPEAVGEGVSPETEEALRAMGYLD